MNLDLTVLVIAVSLALDAVSVSLAGGLVAKPTRIRDGFKVALFFGGFQAGMPLVGWVVGGVARAFVATVSGWVAFGLLALIGLKMIKEAFAERDDATPKRQLLAWPTLTLMAVATSIDALAVGVSLGVLGLPIGLAVTIIGVVTALLSFAAFMLGKQVGKLFGPRIEALGGVALILIGLKILLG